MRMSHSLSRLEPSVLLLLSKISIAATGYASRGITRSRRLQITLVDFNHLSPRGFCNFYRVPYYRFTGHILDKSEDIDFVNIQVHMVTSRLNADQNADAYQASFRITCLTPRHAAARPSVPEPEQASTKKGTGGVPR